jgi:hypothetical protein
MSAERYFAVISITGSSSMADVIRKIAMSGFCSTSPEREEMD